MAGLIAQPRQDRAQLGILMMLAAYLLFAFVDTSVKWLVGLGLPAIQLAFMRYAGHFAIAFAVSARAGSVQILPRENRLLVVVRAGLLISATVFNFFALNHLPLTVTSAIMFSAPIIVCALSVPLLGESVGPWRWFAILLGFAGVLIVIRPFGAAFHWATLLIVYNAISLALFSIITRRLSGVTASGTMQLAMGAIGTAVLLPPALYVWQSPATPLEWGLMFLLGIWGWAGHELFVRAHGFATAITLMPYTYSFMIYLTMTSYLVFGDLPDAFTLIGALIIVLSGLLIWWRESLRRPGHGAA